VIAHRLEAALLEIVVNTKGFMPLDEGDALRNAALAVEIDGPFLEVGAYCGKSAIYLGSAAAAKSTVLFSLDHHRGSEENQSGWEHHDRDLVDISTGRMDTLPFFRKTIEAAKLEHAVVALVGHSLPVATAWKTPLAFLFIDGGHGVEPARNDYQRWTPHVLPRGLLAIHDVFPDPADGGRPPYEEIYLPAIRSGEFYEVTALSCGSLRVLQRRVR
jgi:MMP 1-O-methyltransferase